MFFGNIFFELFFGDILSPRLKSAIMNLYAGTFDELEFVVSPLQGFGLSDEKTLSVLKSVKFLMAA